MAKKDDKIFRLIYTDELTKLYNRRYMRDFLPKIIEEASRVGRKASLFVFDIDDLKRINDQYGHLAGDKALAHFSRLLYNATKNLGLVFRYAGDEFVAFLLGLDREDAKRFGEKFLRIIANSPMKFGTQAIVVMCSIGVSVFPDDGRDVWVLFEHADEALFRAKRRGKGTIEVFPMKGKLLTPEKLNIMLANPPVIAQHEIVEFLERQISPQGDRNVFTVIFGGEGTGKTRVLRYAQELAEKKLAFNLFLIGKSIWNNEPYGAIFQALDHLFWRRPDIKEMVLGRLEEDELELANARFSMENGDFIDPLKSSQTVSIKVFEMLTKMMVHLKSLGDGAILIDNIELIDEPTMQFLDTAFVHDESSKLIYVATVNAPDITLCDEMLIQKLRLTTNIAANAQIKKLELERFSVNDVQKLVGAIFDGEKLPPEAAEAMLRSSNGVPLYIIESLSYLLQSGKITVVGDRWDLSGIRADDIPVSLEDILIRRIGCMEPETLYVLKVATILGDIIDVNEISAITGLNNQLVVDALHTAERSLFVESTSNPEKFVFSHRVNKAALYQALDEQEKIELHRKVAEYDEKLSRKRFIAIGRLAFHRQFFGQYREAVDLIERLEMGMQSVIIPDRVRQLLQKRTFLDALAEQRELTNEDFEKVLAICRNMRAAIQNIRLYPIDNENVQKSLDKLFSGIKEFVDNIVSVVIISFSDESILISGQPLPPSLGDKELAKDLGGLFASYGLRGVIFTHGINRDELVSFLTSFTKKPDEVIDHWEEICTQAGIEHIHPDRIIFVAVGEQQVMPMVRPVFATAAGEAGEVAELPPEHGKLIEDLAGVARELLETLRSKELDEDMKEEVEGKLSDIIGRFEALKESVSVKEEVKEEEVEKKEEEKPKVEEALETAMSAEEEKVEEVEEIVEEVKEKPPKFLRFNEVVSFLVSGEKEARERAKEWMKQFTPKEVAQMFVDAILFSDDDELRKAATKALIELGGEVKDIFLARISPGFPQKQLRRFFEIGHYFAEEPLLLPRITEIIYKNKELAPYIYEFIVRAENPNTDMLLKSLLDSIEDEELLLKVIETISERNVTEALDSLFELVRPKRHWEDELPTIVQVKACEAIGKLDTSKAAEMLTEVVLPKPIISGFKKKPEEVRFAAAKALKSLPESLVDEGVIKKLRKDRNEKIRTLFEK